MTLSKSPLGSRAFDLPSDLLPGKGPYLPPIRTNGLIGSGPVRVDGLLKVTGRAAYGADQPAPGAAHAVLVTSPIALGSITAIDDAGTWEVAGVCDVLTYRNVGAAIGSGRDGPGKSESGYMAQAHPPLSSPGIRFAGQIIGVVIAETAETAAYAASLLRFTLKAEPPAGTLDSPGAEEIDAYAPIGETELSAGDFDKGFAAAAVTIDAWYETPPQHHNPMELFQTTCAWSRDGTQLTVHESSQNVRGFQHGLALQLGLKPENVRVISPYAGGGFGSRGRLGQNTALMALAAKRLGRPVKHVATRHDGFTLKHFRAETCHHLRLGADGDGRLTALDHRSWELASRDDTFAVAGSDASARLYACPNIRTLVTNVSADRQASGFMRGPPETPYLFAMESAMDELAIKLGLDPIEFRRRNETAIETIHGKPYTSRSLLQCMERGSELFGWSQRTPGIGSHSTATEHVGWGYATALYPTQMGPAHCRITLTEDLEVRVEVGAHEIGTGIRTVITQTAADLLGLPMEAVEACIGDSQLPAGGITAGSSSTASICSVIALACEKLRDRLALAAFEASPGAGSPLAGIRPATMRLANGQLFSGNMAEALTAAVRRAGRGQPMVEEAVNIPHGADAVKDDALASKGKPVLLGGSGLSDRMQFAFGSQFVEVRIDRATGMIRVARMVGVFAAGRIMNSRTAWAQLNSGQIWGISSALHEATELDPRYARYVNQDLGEYHIPVSADIGDIQTVMLDEVDTLVNPLGIKGIGELGMTGVNAAIANAIFHATGQRHRKLPIRIGDLPKAAAVSPASRAAAARAEGRRDVARGTSQ